VRFSLCQYENPEIAPFSGSFSESGGLRENATSFQQMRVQGGVWLRFYWQPANRVSGKVTDLSSGLFDLLVQHRGIHGIQRS
jgi:hypothetical protein